MLEVKVLLIFVSLKPNFHQIFIKNCVEHVKHLEKSYWKTDRTIDTKLGKLWIALEVEDNKDDNSEYGDSTEKEKDG